MTIEKLEEVLEESIKYYSGLYSKAGKRSDKSKYYCVINELEIIKQLLNEKEESVKDYINILKKVNKD